MREDTEIRIQSNGTIKISKGESRETGEMKIGNLTVGEHNMSE